MYNGNYLSNTTCLTLVFRWFSSKVMNDVAKYSDP